MGHNSLPKYKLLLNDNATHIDDRYNIAVQQFQMACRKGEKENIALLLSAKSLEVKVDLDNLPLAGISAVLSSTQTLQYIIDIIAKHKVLTSKKEKAWGKSMYSQAIQTNQFEVAKHLIKTYREYIDLSFSEHNVNVLRRLSTGRVSYVEGALDFLKFLCQQLPDPEKYLERHYHVPQNFTELKDEFKLPLSAVEILTTIVEKKEFDKKLREYQTANTVKVEIPVPIEVKKKKTIKL